MKLPTTFALAFVALCWFVPQTSGDDRKVLPPNMKWGTLILTSDDVIPDSVHVFGPDEGTNLSFVFTKKTPEEIEKLKKENLGKKVAIKKGDTVLAVAGAGGCYTDRNHREGLVLIFESKAEAKKGARVLRGEKDE
jgi:hypothetical protein